MNTIFDAFRSRLGQLRPGERCRILIVEDHEDLARVIAILLRHCGFDVKTLHEGGRVLQVARAFRPRYILLDIGLPGIDGGRVAEQIREDPELKDSVLIAISTYGPGEHPMLSRPPRFDHYLTKPFSLEEMLEVLKP